MVERGAKFEGLPKTSLHTIILKKIILIKKPISCDKKAIEKEVDKLLAQKPKNYMGQVTLKEVQSVIKYLNSYAAPGSNGIGTLLIKNGGDYLIKAYKCTCIHHKHSKCI